MTEFWEASFKEKQEMWGWEPADSAIETVELFRKQEGRKILIPGFGYGRNAKAFVDEGFDVTGIEISETAIEIAKRQFGNAVKIHHGSVNSMPFDHDLYDGIYCYALIHLLNNEERIRLIKKCYAQLKPDGYMVFISISKEDFRYGQGEKISKDTFEPRCGMTLFFYDSDSIKSEFSNCGLIDAKIVDEPTINLGNKPAQKFWCVICRKSEK